MADNYIIDTFNIYWVEFLKILPRVIISIVLLIGFYLSAKYISGLVKKKLYTRTNDLLLSGFVEKISKWLFVIFGAMIAMKILGWTNLASGILTGAGISAVIIGFAFKNIGENFLSGLLLAFNRPFNVGDLIVTSGFTGTITSMDFRSTNIKTAEGQDVFIPNSYILNNPLTNYTKDGIRRFDFSIQLDYSANIEVVKELILSSIIKVDEILKSPPPIITTEQLTSNVILKVYYWVNSNKMERNILEVKGQAIENCKESLTDSGIFFSAVTLIKITNEVIPLNIESNKI